MRYTDIYLEADIEHTKQVVQGVFQQNKFKIQWTSPYSGTASRGSKGWNVVGGALAQYYEVGFQIYEAPESPITVRLTKMNIGGFGGLTGTVMVDKKFEDIVKAFADHFIQIGLYRGYHNGK